MVFSNGRSSRRDCPVVSGRSQSGAVTAGGGEAGRGLSDLRPAWCWSVLLATSRPRWLLTIDLDCSNIIIILPVTISNLVTISGGKMSVNFSNGKVLKVLEYKGKESFQTKQAHIAYKSLLVIL